MKAKLQIKNLEFFMTGISAINDDNFKKLLKLDEGDYCEIETWKERNIDFHRKYFALLNCTINHLPENLMVDFGHIDKIRKYIMILIGEFDVIPTLKEDSNPIPQARSISFKSMDNNKFSEIYSKSLDVILKHFLKDISMEDFERDILNFI